MTNLLQISVSSSTRVKEVVRVKWHKRQDLVCERACGLLVILYSCRKHDFPLERVCYIAYDCLSFYHVIEKSFKITVKLYSCKLAILLLSVGAWSNNSCVFVELLWRRELFSCPCEFLVKRWHVREDTVIQKIQNFLTFSSWD